MLKSASSASKTSLYPTRCHPAFQGHGAIILLLFSLLLLFLLLLLHFIIIIVIIIIIIVIIIIVINLFKVDTVTLYVCKYL